MRNQFELFMRNPYYREIYENAPTEKLKQYIRHSWGDPTYVADENDDNHLSGPDENYLSQFPVCSIRFELFMRNPYYRNMYKNAPTEKLRRYFRRAWGDPTYVYDENEDTHLSKPEVEYLAQFAAGGMLKAFFKVLLARFDQTDTDEQKTQAGLEKEIENSNPGC
ncbi:MAG: hypothetical protein IK056_02945 [Clostridia bacterium]|nr:hypothetical protein [Clostridia bacterium]